jgi:transcriptional regulator GlxA family with amidase domain
MYNVAVLVVNPVNGSGLFQYLESFYENCISYKTFAVFDVGDVKTNSGVAFRTDDVVANLKGCEDRYGALVFACGDAVPKFSENSDKLYWHDMFAVMKAFNNKGKILVGHCAAAMFFDQIGIGARKRVAIHPYAKPAVKNAIATDGKYEVDGNLYTARTENSIGEMMPELLRALK